MLISVTRILFKDVGSVFYAISKHINKISERKKKKHRQNIMVVRETESPGSHYMESYLLTKFHGLFCMVHYF